MKAEAFFKESLINAIRRYPYLRDFFSALAISVPNRNRSLGAFLDEIDEQQLAEHGLTRSALKQQCLEFVDQMERYKQQGRLQVGEITVKAGFDKNGRREQHDLVLRPGEVVCVVGPTGSGKSRLLADIECLAQNDTPSGRQVLLDGSVPDQYQRLSGEQQLVAQLSQNMNFVMDLSVREFLIMHAESRLVLSIDEKVEQIYSNATDLAGEPFDLDTPVTALSGGQSRALMIADVAFLSSSPVVLIDEIENAGVDRRRALALLVRKEKIVLIATHDPLLALSGDRRLVIQNGGIEKIIQTSEHERQGLVHLIRIDQKLTRLRNKVRKGEELSMACFLDIVC